jgi:hypothetical protein
MTPFPKRRQGRPTVAQPTLSTVGCEREESNTAALPDRRNKKKGRPVVESPRPMKKEPHRVLDKYETDELDEQFEFLLVIPCAALLEELGKCRRVRLEHHVVEVTAVRPEVLFGVRHDRSPAQRLVAGAHPIPGRHE